jgi:hypothetical protein
VEPLGAASVGLTLSAIILWTGGFADGGYRLANFGYMPNAELIANLIGRLSFFPTLFVVVAAIRNWLGRRKLRPSGVSAGRRAVVFFAILIAVAASLKIFGSIYFSRDEVIAGEARDDLVNSFLSGCSRAQKSKAANTRATDAQIASFCNCIGGRIAATTTYKQMGASNFEDYIKRAATEAAQMCQIGH